MRAMLICAWVLSAAVASSQADQASAKLSAAPSKSALGFRGDARHTGVYDTFGPREQPVIRWRLETNGPIRSSPLLVGSTIYVGSGDHFLRAVDATSGRVRWKFESGGAITSTPCLAEGTVFFASRDRYLYAVSAGQGQLRWKFAMGEDLPFYWGYEYFISSPLVVGNRVYVGGGDGYLYALAAQTGAELWRFKTGGRVRSSPAYAEGVVYVGSMDGNLYALESETGKQVWKFESEGTRIASAKFPFDRKSLMSSPSVGDAMVSVGGRDGFLYGVDRKTGKERWRFNHQMSWVMSSPALAGGIALSGSSDGKFFQAVQQDDGKEKWHFITKSNVYGSGTIAGDAVYFGDQSGEVYALALSTGAKLWQLTLPRGTLCTPAVGEGILYTGCDDGCLYALEQPAVALKPRGPAKRAVYHDPQTKWKWLEGQQQVRDYFAQQGYEVLGPNDLRGFLEARTKDGIPSVVVLASDLLPQEFANEQAMGAIKDYLTSGGKLVCIGMLPLMLELQPRTRSMVFTLDRLKRVFGLHIDYERGLEQHGAVLTQEGLRWGLRKWFVGMQGVEASQVSTVLAHDEVGRAVAWVKSFKADALGSGLVRLWGRQEPYPDFQELKAVAEYGLK